MAKTAKCLQKRIDCKKPTGKIKIRKTIVLIAESTFTQKYDLENTSAAKVV